MAIGVIVKPPATREQYDEVNARIRARGVDPEQTGLLFHAAGAAEDGSWRIVEVWESAEALQRFGDETLGPIVGEVVGPDAPDRTTVMETFSVHAMFGADAGAAA
jgi:hypothetical protein